MLNCFVGFFFFNLSPAIVIFDRGEVKLKDISNGKKERKKKKKEKKRRRRGDKNYERHTDKKGTQDRRSMTQAKQVTTSHNRKISYPLRRKEYKTNALIGKYAPKASMPPYNR